MMINAGLLDDRIAIYKHSNEQSQIGEVNYEWNLHKSYWCDVRQVSARKLLEANREIDESLITVMIRYTEAISVGDRAKWHSRFYDIVNIEFKKKDGCIILSCEVCTE